MRSSILVALLSLFILLFSFLGASVKGAEYSISSDDPPRPPPNPYGGIGLLRVIVHDYGGVVVGLEGVSDPASEDSLSF